MDLNLNHHVSYDYDAQVRNFSVWSNFMYFIAAIYTFTLFLKLHKFYLYKYIFLILSILIFLAGIFSILYHVHTPSFTQNRKIIDTEIYDQYLDLDQGFALTVLIFSLFALFIITYCKWPIFRTIEIKCFFNNSNLYFAVLFVILSTVFYVLGGAYNKQSLNCKRQKCFERRIDGYDIFHSNWHIFTGMTMIFWNTFLYYLILLKLKS